MPATIVNNDIVDVVEVIENQTLYLLCPAEGTPQPSIMWLRDDVPLTFDDLEQLDLASLAGKVRQLSSGRQLELRQVRVEDEAIFQCRATNVAGQQSKRFQLRVLGKLLLLWLYLYRLIKPKENDPYQSFISKSINWSIDKCDDKFDCSSVCL